MKPRVHCYSGHRGEQTPRRILLGDRRLEVLAVTREWVEPDGRCFEVECDDGHRYRLRQVKAEDEWRLDA